MNKLLAVMRREYLSRVRNKWFVFSTLLIPVLMVGLIGLPALLVIGQQPEAVRISVIDMTGELLPELLETEAFRDGSFFFVAPPAGDRQVVARDLLTEWIADEELDGYLYVPADVLEGGRVEYWGRGRNVSNPLVVTSLRSATNTALRRLQARELGIDPAAAELLTRSVALDTYRVSGEGASREGRLTWVTAEVLGLAVYMVILLYGAMMLRASVSEKSNKMIEVILASIRPWQLMLGKTLGVGAVGLTQITVWIGFAAIGLLYVTSTSTVALDILAQLPLGLDTLALFVGLFLTGYFIYAGLYASVGAIANSEQDASQLQLPVTLIAILPAILLPSVLNNPAATSSVALSWIPVFAPVVFIGRYVLGAAETWEIPVVFAIQLATIALVAWIGGRIFRVGLLMTGVRPTVREIARWVRHG